MSDNDCVVFFNHYWLQKSEFFDRIRNSVDLIFSMNFVVEFIRDQFLNLNFFNFHLVCFFEIKRRTEVFSLATCSAECFKIIECFTHSLVKLLACFDSLFCNGSRRTISTNVFCFSNIQLIQNIFWLVLQVRVLIFCTAFCRTSFRRLSPFNIVESFDVCTSYSFSQESRCNVYIKRGNWFRRIYISEFIFWWSAYSVLLFGIIFVNTMGKQRFRMRLNHEVWHILKIQNRVFQLLFVLVIFLFCVFFSLKKKSVINIVVSITLRNFLIEILCQFEYTVFQFKTKFFSKKVDTLCVDSVVWLWQILKQLNATRFCWLRVIFCFFQVSIQTQKTQSESHQDSNRHCDSFSCFHNCANFYDKIWIDVRMHRVMKKINTKITQNKNNNHKHHLKFSCILFQNRK